MKIEIEGQGEGQIQIDEEVKFLFNSGFTFNTWEWIRKLWAVPKISSQDSEGIFNWIN